MKSVYLFGYQTNKYHKQLWRKLRKILETLQGIEQKSNFRNQHHLPRMSDIEVITLSLTAEYMGTDSEYQLFRMLSGCLRTRIERSVCNRRCRALFPHLSALCKHMGGGISSAPDYLIVDGMPLEVCRISRSSRSTEYYSAPDKGFCASQQIYYYNKLHVVCSLEGVIRSFDLSKISVHDIHYLKDIKELYRDCVLLGDRGYLSTDYLLDLFESRNCIGSAHATKSERLQAATSYIPTLSKKIETLFSQLCDQFMIRRNYAKSFDGFRTRIIAKIMAFNTIKKQSED